MEGHRTLERADCPTVGSGGAGWSHTGRRSGQSPEATLQGFPQVWPLFCIVWLFQVGPWGRERSGEQGATLPPYKEFIPLVCVYIRLGHLWVSTFIHRDVQAHRLRHTCK